MAYRPLALAGLAAVLASATGTSRSVYADGAVTQMGVGERLVYDVSFGVIHIGTAEVSVVESDTLCSRAVWHAVLTLRGGLPPFRVNDKMSSWFDPVTFSSCRFTQVIREGSYHADRDFRITPEHSSYTTKGVERPSVSEPLDDLSFVYFLRSLHIEPGRTYTFRRYFQLEGNPVTIHVIRRERVSVPAGTFNTMLVEPRITTQGLFADNGKAQLWFSDDSARVLLQLKSRLSFGSINFYLRQVTATTTK